MKFQFTNHNKVLFWVAGYTADLNTDNAVAKINDLKNHATSFAEAINVPLEDVNTFEVRKSRRYQNMRVFYVKDFEGTLPPGTFEINHHTFSEWIGK